MLFAVEGVADNANARKGEANKYPPNTFALRQVQLSMVRLAIDPHTGRVYAMSGVLTMK